MLLIYPPITKACEPPGGLPILGAALKSHNIDYKILDMNVGGQNYLLDKYFKNSPKKEFYRDLIREQSGYNSYDRYIKCVNELSRGIKMSNDSKSQLSLANYNNTKLTPLKSRDLIESFKLYKENPFYEYYHYTLHDLLSRGTINNVGVSIQFLNQALCAFALIGYIKSNFPEIKVVIGGGLVTSWGKSPSWNNPFKDYIDKIIVGPGERAILEHLGIVADESLLKDLVPDYDILDCNRYFSPGNIVPISGSLGCSWKRCTFCPEQAEDNPFIPQRVSSVISKMLELKKRYDPILFHFLDNEISPVLLKELTKSNIGVSWYGFTKFYSILKNVDFCRKLKLSGCSLLKLGLESGDQSVLDSMNKGIKLEDVEIILKNLSSVGIKTYIYLLFGTPGEDYVSAKKTFDFVIKHNKSITYLNLAIFNLPIGSELAKRQKTFDHSDADLSMYRGFEHPKGWDRADVRLFLNSEFKSDPIVKKILKRTPGIFNANHCPVLNSTTL